MNINEALALGSCADSHDESGPQDHCGVAVPDGDFALLADPEFSRLHRPILRASYAERALRRDTILVCEIRVPPDLAVRGAACFRHFRSQAAIKIWPMASVLLE